MDLYPPEHTGYPDFCRVNAECHGHQLAVFNRFLFPEGMEAISLHSFHRHLAAETAVAIAIMINIYRNLRSIQVRNLDELKW